jgi:hypothetical protein
MKQKISALIFGGVAAILVVVSGSAGAQSQPGSGLSISPTLFSFTLKPGASTPLEINLKNITTDNVVAKAFINDFEADNVTGNPKIITNPVRSDPHIIKPFLQGVSDVPLPKGQQKKISLSINVPANQSPGAYYGIVRYRAVPEVLANNDQGVSLTASVGAIVLITVPGNIQDQVQLAGVHVYNVSNNKQHEHTLFTSKPERAGIEMKNLGNGFAAPYGTVELSDMGGHRIFSYQLNNNTPRSNILPGSSRVFDNPLKNIKGPGRYTLTANVVYGADASILVGKKTFWYIPAWLLFVIAAVLAVIVLLAARAYRRHGASLRRSHRRKR